MPTVHLSSEELALVVEALEDNAGVFKEGAKDTGISDEERADFARDAERCLRVAERLSSTK